jgi:hypothetical protein
LSTEFVTAENQTSVSDSEYPDMAIMNSSLGNNIAGIGAEERREEKLHNPVTENGTGHARGQEKQTSGDDVAPTNLKDNSEIESGPQGRNFDKIGFKSSELQEEGAVGVIAAGRSVVIPAGRVKFTAMRIQGVKGNGVAHIKLLVGNVYIPKGCYKYRTGKTRIAIFNPTEQDVELTNHEICVQIVPAESESAPVQPQVTCLLQPGEESNSLPQEFSPTRHRPPRPKQGSTPNNHRLAVGCKVQFLAPRAWGNKGWVGPYTIIRQITAALFLIKAEGGGDEVVAEVTRLRLCSWTGVKPNQTRALRVYPGERASGLPSAENGGRRAGPRSQGEGGASRHVPVINRNRQYQSRILGWGLPGRDHRRTVGGEVDNLSWISRPGGVRRTPRKMST